jgi:hypothetical protein
MRPLLLLLLLAPVALTIPTAAAAAAATATDGAAAAANAADGEAPAVVVGSIEIELPTAAKSETTAGDDQNEKCPEWAAAGECQNNPSYMLEGCPFSCGGTNNGEDGSEPTKATAKAYVYEGEDASIGAFRFAEMYSSAYEIGTIITIPTPVVLDVAKQLQETLAASGYKPPQEVTHCGGGGDGKKKKPCSAGKLWKRSEEMRKADMHDAAGADLIRALLKTGLEVDFVERSEKSLGWALGSIRRQRERERRDAVEEAKAEERREEERAAMEEADRRRAEYEADWVKFGTQVQESVASGSEEATVGADGQMDVDEAKQELISSVRQTFISDGPQGGNWNATLQILRKLSPSDKTIDVLLIEARCHEMLSNHKSALSAAGRLVQKAANHDPWINGSPRMMAATLGANAAMQLGLSENAISFYQTVLKFDPEQEQARKQYRGLKKVVKLMGKAEEQVRVLFVVGMTACSCLDIRLYIMCFLLHNLQYIYGISNTPIHQLIFRPSHHAHYVRLV